MTTNLTPKFALAVLFALLATASIRAGTITVGNLPATGTDAATGISAANTYLCCLDFGSYNTTTYSINGVNFQHLDPGNQTVNTVSGTESAGHGGTYTISSGPQPLGPACKLARTSSTTQGSPSSQADGTSLTMFYDLIYVGSSGPVGSWLNQTYGGLIPTAQYALRVYYRQWASDNRSVNIAFNGEGTTQLYSGNPLNLDAGGAHYIEYDFTASSTSVFMGMTNQGNNVSAMIYFMTLQQTAGPPPPLVAATINTQPAGFTNWVELTNTLSVVASGNPAPTYQ